MNARTITVLVVDDRPDVRLSLLYVLEGSGYAVAEAADGHQAVAAIAKRRIDVALADLSMARMDGPTLIRLLRDRSVSTPKLILMTGSHLLGVAISGAALTRLGADAILLKPFNREMLLQTIEGVLPVRAEHANH